MTQRDSDDFATIDRRRFLGYAATTPVAVVSPSPISAAMLPKTDFMKRAMPLLVHGVAPRLSIHDLWYNWQETLASPLSVEGNKEVINWVYRLQRSMCEWSSITTSPYVSMKVGELTSDNWDAFEKEWLPILYPSNHENNQKFAKARHNLAAEFQRLGLSEEITLGEAAEQFKARCIVASHQMIHQAYQRDPMGFIKVFHEDGANMGLQLHYYFDPKKGYKDFGEWIPSGIAKHIESLFPFSNWGKSEVKPTALANHIFSLGGNADGKQLFHLALTLPQAKQALTQMLGEDAVNALHFKDAKAGGVLVTFLPDQYKMINNQIAASPQDDKAPERTEIPVPVISGSKIISAKARQSEIG